MGLTANLNTNIVSNYSKTFSGFYKQNRSFLIDGRATFKCTVRALYLCKHNPCCSSCWFNSKSQVEFEDTLAAIIGYSYCDLGGLEKLLKETGKFKDESNRFTHFLLSPKYKTTVLQADLSNGTTVSLVKILWTETMDAAQRAAVWYIAYAESLQANKNSISTRGLFVTPRRDMKNLTLQHSATCRETNFCIGHQETTQGTESIYIVNIPLPLMPQGIHDIFETSKQMEDVIAAAFDKRYVQPIPNGSNLSNSSNTTERAYRHSPDQRLVESHSSNHRVSRQASKQREERVMDLDKQVHSSHSRDLSPGDSASQVRTRRPRERSGGGLNINQVQSIPVDQGRQLRELVGQSSQVAVHTKEEKKLSSVHTAPFVPKPMAAGPPPSSS